MTQQRQESRKSGSDSVFFVSETQATDSTATGWMAKRRPLSQAPGIRMRSSSAHRSSEATMCSTIVVMW